MPDKKAPVNLDENEASLALHAIRFYKNAKGGEVSDNTERLESKLDEYLSDTTFEVSLVENVASILGARGGIKGGASTSAAKKSAAAANGAKGGRPRKPNLFIKFSKSVWLEPDPTLLNELYTSIGSNTWLPDEIGGEIEGPYVQVVVPEVTGRLEKLLSKSMNVFEWDKKGLYRYCVDHKNEMCSEIRLADKPRFSCLTCGRPAEWIY